MTATRTAPMPLPEAIDRLARSATRRLSTGQGPRTVLAWLSKPSTAAVYGSDAVAIVAVVIGTRAVQAVAA